MVGIGDVWNRNLVSPRAGWDYKVMYLLIRKGDVYMDGGMDGYRQFQFQLYLIPFTFLQRFFLSHTKRREEKRKEEKRSEEKTQGNRMSSSSILLIPLSTTATENQTQASHPCQKEKKRKKLGLRAVDLIGSDTDTHTITTFYKNVIAYKVGRQVGRQVRQRQAIQSRRAFIYLSTRSRLIPFLVLVISRFFAARVETKGDKMNTPQHI